MAKINPLKLRSEVHASNGTYKEQQPDFIIKVEDETIPVHKDLLCTVSEYFRGMVESGMAESQDGILEIKETKPCVVQTIIKYFYGEEVFIPWEEVKDYLDLVELWQIPELKSSFDKYIDSHVSPSDCVEWYHFAKLYDLKVMQRVHIFLKCNFLEAFKSDYFKALEHEEFIAFLTTKDLLSPNAALEACISWTMSEESRKPMFENLLTHVAITECNPARLKYLVKKDLVTSPAVCAEINRITVASSTILTLDRSASNPQVVLLDKNTLFNAITSGSCSQLRRQEEKEGIVVLNAKREREIVHVETGEQIFTVCGPPRQSGYDSYECMLLDPSTLEVKQLPPIFGYSSRRYESITVAAVSNKLYVMNLFAGHYAMIYLDTQSSEQWEEIPLPEHIKHSRMYSVCTEGKFIFFILGTKFYSYDTDHSRWLERSGPTPDSRFYTDNIFVSGLGHLYVLFSHSENVEACLKFVNGTKKVLGHYLEHRTTHYRYSIASDTWTELSRPPQNDLCGRVTNILRPPQMDLTSKAAVFLETSGEICWLCEGWYDNNRTKYYLMTYNIAADTWRHTECKLKPYECGCKCDCYCVCECNCECCSECVICLCECVSECDSKCDCHKDLLGAYMFHCLKDCWSYQGPIMGFLEIK